MQQNPPLCKTMPTLPANPRTEAIGAFIETIRQPDRFTGSLDRAAAMGKPVVVLKVGRSERTRRAVSTHTVAIRLPQQRPAPSRQGRWFESISL
jgi:acyl-CoA synthetase (NDP forming)